jgi:hypothetical protein
MEARLLAAGDVMLTLQNVCRLADLHLSPASVPASTLNLIFVCRFRRKIYIAFEKSPNFFPNLQVMCLAFVYL